MATLADHLAATYTALAAAHNTPSGNPELVFAWTEAATLVGYLADMEPENVASTLQRFATHGATAVLAAMREHANDQRDMARSIGEDDPECVEWCHEWATNLDNAADVLEGTL